MNRNKVLIISFILLSVSWFYLLKVTSKPRNTKVVDDKVNLGLVDCIKHQFNDGKIKLNEHNFSDIIEFWISDSISIQVSELDLTLHFNGENVELTTEEEFEILELIKPQRVIKQRLLRSRIINHCQ